MKHRLLAATLVSTWLAVPSLCLAQVAAPTASSTPWSASFPDIGKDIQAGRPLVTVVVVPLCSNAQINCGASWAGQPGRLETNIYWGAIFGARRFLQRQGSGWQTIQVTGGSGELLERVVLRRSVSGTAWGRTESVEQIVELQAVHGSQIDAAIDRFWGYATQGGSVTFEEAGTTRTERIHVVGYNGHNRLMDGKRLGKAPTTGRAIPSFVMACISESYFGPELRAAGSFPLLTTRSLMAPEGYLLNAILSGLGDNLTRSQLRESAISVETKWLKIPVADARHLFAP